MAEAILSNVAGYLLAELGSPVLQEIGLLWGVKDELEKFKGTVSNVQAVLLDAEEQYVESHQVREWLRQLKEVLYDADNLLDDFSPEALRGKAMTGNKVKKEVRLFLSRIYQPVYGLRMAHKVKKMRGRLDDIANGRKFHLVERPLEKLIMLKDREQTHSHPPEIVVGRDGDKEAIIDVLLSRSCEENVGVIPIVGFGGLGKTTLAQLVFNDERVKGHFEVRLWVCVADNFDVKLLVEKILGSGSSGRLKDIEMDPLVDLLHEKINGKKYLIVLDDVWNEDMDKWSRLKDLLVGGARGSRIVITTRLNQVAHMTHPMETYELRGLSKGESWFLFTQMAFGRGQVPSESHMKIGEEIVTRCSGVPLAVKAIGRLLYFRTTISEWISFKDKEFLHIGQVKSNIMPILRLSYDLLPSHLKNCFAYCRIFPKDHLIDVQKLTSLWMAQGFLKSSNSAPRPEDVGFECFIDLLWRSFFQDVEKDELGNMVSCKMHDLMHDLAIEVAGVETVTSNSVGEFVSRNTRHVSVFLDDHNSSWKVPPSLLESKDLRTFLLLHESWGEFGYGCKIGKDQQDVIFSKLRRLRVLDLHYTAISVVPHSIGKLKYLRQLDLSYNRNIKMLPDSITKLYNLQVLNLEYCGKLKELPKDIKRLANLCQLIIHGCWDLTHMPKGLGQLTYLSKLSRFVVRRHTKAGTLNELGELKDLRGQLEIQDLPHGKTAVYECAAVNLKEKQHLQSLTLAWDTGNLSDTDVENDELALEALEPHLNLKELSVTWYLGLKFPSWLGSLCNLVKIYVYKCQNCWHLPPLHQLPGLVTLEISYLTALEYIDNGESSIEANGGTTQYFFPCLKSLHLICCTKLKGWWKIAPTLTIDHLPRFNLLSDLTIWNCPKIQSMPLFPPLTSLTFSGASIKSLQEILSTSDLPPQFPSSGSSRSLALSRLQDLEIRKVEDLEYLPEDMLRNLTSLKNLHVCYCPKLKTLDQAFRHLVSLERLKISYCQQLNVSDDDEVLHWEGHKCLLYLHLYRLPQFVYLPNWIQRLPALQELKIDCCENLKSLPEWMRQVTSLEKLFICHSPLLLKRCGSNRSQDWPYIAHIPFVKVDSTVVQRYGRCLL